MYASKYGEIHNNEIIQSLCNVINKTEYNYCVHVYLPQHLAGQIYLNLKPYNLCRDDYAEKYTNQIYTHKVKHVKLTSTIFVIFKNKSNEDLFEKQDVNKLQ